MSTKINQTIEETMEEIVNNEEVVVENAVEETFEAENANSFKDNLRALIAQGCKRFNRVRIKNVNITERENDIRVSFTLHGYVPGYASTDNGETYHKSKVNIVYTSLYAIAGTFKEIPNLAWCANTILEKPKALELILSNAEIDIIQQELTAGEVYTNPFSSKQNKTEYFFDHDTIINHVVNYNLSKVGEKSLELLQVKMLGF